MALIVETGSNVANSNSYVSVAEANSYHTLFNNTDWTGLSDSVAEQLAIKEGALIQATLAIELMFGDIYKAPPAYKDQSLLFPTFTFAKNGWQIVEQGTIPKELKDAVCEVALLYVQGVDIFPNLNPDNNIRSVSKSVDGLSKSVTYFGKENIELYKGFGKVEKIIRPIIKCGEGRKGSGILSL